MYYLKHYIIDWGNVKTTEDLIVILKSMNLSFENPSDELQKLCTIVDKDENIMTCDQQKTIYARHEAMTSTGLI